MSSIETGSRRSVTDSLSRSHPPKSLSYVTPGAGCTAVIVALVEGRGLAKGEIGMASFDLKRPEVILSQFSDSQTYTQVMMKLQVMQPIEVLMPSTACEAGNMTVLFKMISNMIKTANMVTVHRKYFNEAKGLSYIKELCLLEYRTVELEVSTKYYCLATAAALIKYVEYIQDAVYAPGFLKVTFQGSENTAMIDISTAENLELLSNAHNPASAQSLYGVLNHTKTPSGARLLRSNILQPSCDTETIHLRQECVKELTENEVMFYSVESVLGQFLDVDHLLSLCIKIPKNDNMKTAESKITKVIHLKHTLELVSTLLEAIKFSESELLVAYATILQDNRLRQMHEKISLVLHDDTQYEKCSLNMKTQRCFAVRSGMNGLLDVARRTYTDIIDDIAVMATCLSSKYNLPIKVCGSNSRGFYMQLYTGAGAPPELDVDNLPSDFMKISKNRNTINFSTADLLRLNDRAQEATKEIYVMTNVVVNELIKDLRSNIGCLYKLAECVSMLDMLHSFAKSCTLSSYVRPEFTDTLAVKQSRHPILDIISFNLVPNNIFASRESNFILITGPNMSGKTTYLKQVALLQIMAQVGSFVPAVYASFRVTSQIFSRVGSDDDISSNSSTFMLEMRELSYVLQNVSSNCLVIVDELGRGTSNEEGFGICHAVCEHLLTTKSFVFFATHYQELNNLELLYPTVRSYHFNNKETCSSHFLEQGSIEHPSTYGLFATAAVSSFPPLVLTRAFEIEQKLQHSSYVNLDCSQSGSDAIKLASLLIQTSENSSLKNVDLQKYFHYAAFLFRCCSKI